MPLKANFTENDIRRRFDSFLEAVIKRQIERLQNLGELCVKHAKLIPPDIGFTDQTGNLRSSIGYIIFQDGVAIHEAFEQVKEGKEGMDTGRKHAELIGQGYTEGIVLVVVAGMNYAVYVEAKGRDVLASAERLAQEQLPKMLKALTDNIGKAIMDM